jgi:WD40 repeat protein
MEPSGHDIRTLYGHTYYVMSVASSPDGKRIVSTGGDGTVKVWDVSRWTR